VYKEWRYQVHNKRESIGKFQESIKRLTNIDPQESIGKFHIVEKQFFSQIESIGL